MVTMATLIEAAKNGHYDTVEQVLRTGRADINCRERESGGTALFWAANCGHKEIVELLLHYGADVEIAVKWQFTPLLAAVDRKHFHTAKTLLTGGANVNVQSEKGDTPLHLAAFRGSIHLCKLLLYYHAQTGILNNNGKTPQQEAEGEGHTAITKLLAPETNQRAVYRSSSLPLSYQNVARIPSESDESLLPGNRPRGSLRRQLLRQSQIVNNDCSSPFHRHESELVKSHSTNLLQTVGKLSPPNQAGDASFKGRRSPSSPLVQYHTLGRVSPPILQGISQNFHYHYPGSLTKRRNSPPAISRNLLAQTAPIAPAHVILRQPPVSREGETPNRPKETPSRADGHSGHHQCKRLDRETNPQSFSSFQSPKDVRQTCASSSTVSNTNGDMCLKLCDGPSVKSDSFPEIDRLLNIIEDLERDKISLLNENQNLRETVQSLESLVDLSMTTEGSSSSNSSCPEQSCKSCGDRTMRGSSVLDVEANQRILLLEATCRDLAADNHKLQSQVIALSQGQTIVEEDETVGVQKVNGDIQGLETTTSEVSDSRQVRAPTTDSMHESKSSSLVHVSANDKHSPLQSSLGRDSNFLLNSSSNSKLSPSSKVSSFASECWHSLSRCNTSRTPSQVLQFIQATVGSLSSPRSKDSVMNMYSVAMQSLRDMDTSEWYPLDDSISDATDNICLKERIHRCEGRDNELFATFRCTLSGRQRILEVSQVSACQGEGDTSVWSDERCLHVLQSLPPHRNVTRPLARWETCAMSDDHLTRATLARINVEQNSDCKLVFSVYPDFQISIKKLFDSVMGEGGQDLLREPCLLRILLQLLLGVQHLQAQSVAHRDIQPRHVHVGADMRVTLGGFEHAALMLDQGGAPRPFDDVTQIGAGNPLARAPELIRHTIHGPPQIWEHRIPLSAVYASSDLYAVAATICSLLVTPSDQSEQAVGDDPSELLSHLPDWLSPSLSALLQEMLRSSPEKRPPIRAALLRVAMLLFGPHPEEMKSQLDCEMWLTSQAMRLLLSTPTDQHEKPMPGMHGCREAQDRLDWVLCRDYILNITPLHLWQLYQKYQMT